jgi:hypothetical protein
MVFRITSHGSLDINGLIFVTEMWYVFLEVGTYLSAYFPFLEKQEVYEY